MDRFDWGHQPCIAQPSTRKLIVVDRGLTVFTMLSFENERQVKAFVQELNELMGNG